MTAKSTGYLVGPVLGGARLVAGGYRALLPVTGVVALIAAIGVSLSMPADPEAAMS